MRNTICLLAVIGVGLAGTACEMQPSESAVAGASPPAAIPIGPIPGPPQPTAVQANPFAEDRSALAEGRRLFVQYNCYGCHGGHAGGGMGPSLRDEVWIYGGDPARIFSSISQGRAHGMPAWGTRLSEEQIWKLAAYIKSMRTALEPDPPEQK